MLSAEYTAGFLDGEGSFQLYVGRTSRSNQRSVQAHNTYLPVLIALRDTWGGNVYEVQHKNSPLAKKPLWKWIVGDAPTMIPLLEAIIPHLQEKRQQAETLLEAAKLVKPRGVYHHQQPSVRRVV